jgi:hypothetical protein
MEKPILFNTETEKELIKFLKKNLRICVRACPAGISGSSITIKLLLGNEVISSDYFYGPSSCHT